MLGRESRERKSNKKVRKINFLQELGQEWEDGGPQEHGGRRVLGGDVVLVDDNLVVFLVHPE
jgi:hypothetical protein